MIDFFILLLFYGLKVYYAAIQLKIIGQNNDKKYSGY